MEQASLSRLWVANARVASPGLAHRPSPAGRPPTIPPSLPTSFDKANAVEARRLKSLQLQKEKGRSAFLSEQRCHRAVSCNSARTALPQNPRDKMRRTQAVPNDFLTRNRAAFRCVPKDFQDQCITERYD